MVVEIIINYGKCIDCQECVETCSYGALKWLDEMLTAVNSRKCKACSKCRLNCSVDAIGVVEK